MIRVMMIYTIFSAYLLSSIAFPIDDPYVDIPGLGSLQGVISNVSDSVSVFMGIPYGKAPVGKLRWQPPQAHGPWQQNPLNASWFADRCMQGDSLSPKTSGMSEDCLFLNIAAPTITLNSLKKIPVMLWIHGGGYYTGESNDYPFDRLVMHSSLSVIVVTINYRLNVFGFLGSAEIQKRTYDGSAGNFGIQDQRLALSWVRDHIGSFGGDGADITIFGESAGGNSVINHLTQPASFPLYTKAIVESGAYDTGGMPFVSAEKLYDATLKSTDCDDLVCLLSLDAKVLLTKFPQTAQGHGPVIDGVCLLAAPTDIIAQGKHNNKVPVIMGSNRDEEALFYIVFQIPLNLTETEFDAIHAKYLNTTELKEIKQLYDPTVYPYPKDLGNYSIWWWTSMRIVSDGVWSFGPCGVRNLSRSLLKGGTPMVFNYLFAHPTQAPGDGSVPGMGPGSVVVPHESEIYYAFGAADLLTPGEEAQLSLSVSAYWYTFAITGKPKPHHLPTWPKYTIEDDMILRLDIPTNGGIRPQHALRKMACDYMDVHTVAPPF